MIHVLCVWGPLGLV